MAEATRTEMTGTSRVVRLTRAEFDALPEYSLSIPTGTTIGKRWKRDESAVVRLHHRGRSEAPSWVLGEYYDIGDPKNLGIRWTPIEVVEEAPEQPAAASSLPADRAEFLAALAAITDHHAPAAGTLAVLAMFDAMRERIWHQADELERLRAVCGVPHFNEAGMLAVGQALLDRKALLERAADALDTEGGNDELVAEIRAALATPTPTRAPREETTRE